MHCILPARGSPQRDYITLPCKCFPLGHCTAYPPRAHSSPRYCTMPRVPAALQVAGRTLHPPMPTLQAPEHLLNLSWHCTLRCPHCTAVQAAQQHSAPPHGTALYYTALHPDHCTHPHGMLHVTLPCTPSALHASNGAASHSPRLDTASQRAAACTSVEPHRDLVTCIALLCIVLLCIALLHTASRSSASRRPHSPTQPARPNPTWPYLRGPQTLGAPRGRLQPIRASREAAPTSRRREGSERSVDGSGAGMGSAPSRGP